MYKSSGNLQRKNIIKTLHRKINLENLSQGSMINVVCYHTFCKKNSLKKLMLPLRLWNNWPKINSFTHNSSDIVLQSSIFYKNTYVRNLLFLSTTKQIYIIIVWESFTRGFTPPSWFKVLTYFKQCPLSAAPEKQVFWWFHGIYRRIYNFSWERQGGEIIFDDGWTTYDCCSNWWPGNINVKRWTSEWFTWEYMILEKYTIIINKSKVNIENSLKVYNIFSQDKSYLIEKQESKK